MEPKLRASSALVAPGIPCRDAIQMIGKKNK
jgi:hypothetical protein